MSDLGFIPKACGDRVISYQIVGWHATNVGEFVKGPYPHGYIFESNNNMIMGLQFVGFVGMGLILGVSLFW